MKKFTLITLVAVFTAALLTGCGCTAGTPNETVTTTPTRPTETRIPTTPPTTTMPDMTMPAPDEMVPGTDDTIDPTNGADDGMVDPTNGANQDGASGRGASSPF